MTTLERTLNYLDRSGICYAHATHPAAYTARGVAAAEHIPSHRVAKTVVFHTDAGYGMAVVAADEFVDFEELRVLMGASNIRLATEEELARLFAGSELGAMPPFGNLFGIPIYMDRELLLEASVAFNAGTHRDVIHMNVSDYVRLAKPMIRDFAIRVGSATD